VANLSGTGSGPKANGATYLVPGATVVDDGAVDSLFGGAQVDWFFYNFFQDVASDKAASENGKHTGP
jgi:hypothetical protein